VFVLVLGGSCSRSADAQDLSSWNLFAGAGGFTSREGGAGAWQVGGGVDVPVAPSASIGGDVGLVGPTGDGVERSSYASVGNVFLISFNGAYHFTHHDAQQARPFVTGGVEVITANREASGGLNVGGGIDWWLRERRGVRVEVRDQLLAEFGATHLVTVRVGLIFR